MVDELFSHKHADDDSCPSCGTPIKPGLTTQYLEDLDVEICAVCEHPLRDKT